MTERIDIVVSERGAGQAARAVRGVGSAADGASGALRQLQSALVAVGGALAIRQLIQAADAFTNLQNRLRTVTDSAEGLAYVQKELLGIANRTRQDLTGVAEVYARVASSTAELGVSTNELLQFTESLGQAVALSGASAQEAGAALRQFAQGIAAGALRGEELNSVLEQLPIVADVIAQELGVTRGALRQLAEQGEITSEVILSAFRSAEEELSSGFAVSVPTVSQSLQVLENNLLAFVGTFDQATGASAALSEAILFVANNIDIVMPYVAGLVTAIGVTLALRAIPAAIAAIRALSASMVSTPWGAIAAAVGLIAGALVTLEAESASAAEGAGVVASRLADVSGAMAAVERAADAYGDAIQRVRLGQISATDDIVAATKSEYEAKQQLLQVEIERARILQSDRRTRIQDATREYDQLRAEGLGVAEEYNRLIAAREDGRRMSLDAQAYIALAPDRVSAMYDRGMELDREIRELGAAITLTEGEIGRAEDLMARQFEVASSVTGSGAAGSGSGGSFGEEIASLEEEISLLRLAGTEREALAEILRIETRLKRDLTDDEEALVRAGVAQADALTRQNRIYDEIRGPQEEYRANAEALNTLLDQGRISTDEHAEAMRRLREAIGDTGGDLETLQDALSNYAGRAADLGTQISDAFESGFRNAEDVIVEFVQTGKLEFSDLVDSIISDIIRIQARTNVTAPLSDALSGLVGSMIGSISGSSGSGMFGTLTSSLTGYDTGGTLQVSGASGIDNNVLSINGNASARVSDGELIEISRGENRGGTQVIVHNYGQDRAEVRQSRGSSGDDVIEIIVGKAKSAVAADITQGGTPISRAISGRYGLNEAGGL